MPITILVNIEALGEAPSVGHEISSSLKDEIVVDATPMLEGSKGGERVPMSGMWVESSTMLLKGAIGSACCVVCVCAKEIRRDEDERRHAENRTRSAIDNVCNTRSSTHPPQPPSLIFTDLPMIVPSSSVGVICGILAICTRNSIVRGQEDKCREKRRQYV